MRERSCPDGLGSRGENLGSIFVDLRDTTGITQIVFDDTISEDV